MMTTTMSTLHRRMARGAWTLGMLLSSQAALAVNNLPGGPAVNQIDLPPPVTRIAADIQRLHNFVMLICLVIFIAVFGVMFYSILKHRKSVGHKAANFHESVTVEIAWTVVPFIIVIGMGAAGHQDGGGDEGHQQRRPDDQGHRLPVEVGLRLPAGAKARASPSCRRSMPTQREMSDAGTPKGDDYLLQGRQPAGGAGGQEDPHHHHRQRRDPRLDGAGLRRQAGRDSRLRARHLVPRRQDRRLLRPVRRAVRQGTRLHADPREGAEPRRLQRLGRRPRRRKWRRWPTTRTRSGRWPTWSAAARRSTPPTAPPATRPAARAPGRSSRSTARRWCSMPTRSSRSPWCCNGVNNGAMPSWKQLSDTELAAVITFTKNNWCNKTGQLVQPAEVAAARK